MNKTIVLNFILIFIFNVTSHANFKYNNKSAHAKRKIQITGIIANKIIKLTGSDFDRAISSNIPLVTPPIVQACVFSPKSQKNLYLLHQRIGKMFYQIILLYITKD